MTAAPDPTLDLAGAEADAPPAPLRSGQLTEGWRWLFALGWSLVAPALMAVGDASHSLGKPTWWLDDAGRVAWWTPLVFLPIVAAAASGAWNWRAWPIFGAAAVVTLAVTAAVDVAHTPSVAVAEAVLAAAGAATTGAAFAGRVRVPWN